MKNNININKKNNKMENNIRLGMIYTTSNKEILLMHASLLCKGELSKNKEKKNLNIKIVCSKNIGAFLLNLN